MSYRTYLKIIFRKTQRKRVKYVKRQWVGNAMQPINMSTVLRSQAVTAEFTVKRAHFSKDLPNFPVQNNPSFAIHSLP